MISNLGIEGFKCFKTHIDFPLSKINLMIGYNGRGKSSVLQSLLMLGQSLTNHKNVEKLDVNGDFVKLGTFQDVVSGKGNWIRITVSDEKEVVSLGYRKSNNSNWIGELSELKINDKDWFESAGDLDFSQSGRKKRINSSYSREFHRFFENFVFISASRLGPTAYEEKVDVMRENPLGNEGERRLNYLVKDEVLLKKVSEAISWIMDGGSFSVRGRNEEDAVLSLAFSMGKNLTRVKSINVGYGYSYILPIVIMALSAKNCTLFIENPEAHLHPLAQSRLMQLLCKIPLENNVQVFIETHSEHILNAVRLCSLKDEFPIATTDISIHFFDKDYSVKYLAIDNNAQLSEWPLGFFDQQERDLAEILKLGLLKA